MARVKTYPKEFVCSEDCEQHALYGRMFDSHPLEQSEKPLADSEDEEEQQDLAEIGIVQLPPVVAS